MTTLAVPVLFADFDGNFESKLFSDLAGQGDKGIIIALIIALIVLSAAYAGLCAWFRWCEVRRYERKEIARDVKLTSLRIEETDSRTKLAETQGALTKNVEVLTHIIEETSQRLNDNIRDVKDQVQDLSQGISDIKSTVMKHEEDIARHEGVLSEHGERIDHIDPPKPARKRGRKDPSK